MKVRLGFVSNSSSSSFCMFGVCFEGVDDAYANVKESIKEMNPVDVDDEDSFLNEYDMLDEVVTKQGLSVYSPYDDYSYCYVGLTIDNMKDDETRADFRKRAFDKLSKVFDNISLDKISLMQEGWYDG